MFITDPTRLSQGELSIRQCVCENKRNNNDKTNNLLSICSGARTQQYNVVNTSIQHHYTVLQHSKPHNHHHKTSLTTKPHNPSPPLLTLSDTQPLWQCPQVHEQGLGHAVHGSTTREQAKRRPCSGVSLFLFLLLFLFSSLRNEQTNQCKNEQSSLIRHKTLSQTTFTPSSRFGFQ